jgi:hypothetical protein
MAATTELPDPSGRRPTRQNMDTENATKRDVVVVSHADVDTFVGFSRLTKVLIDRSCGVHGASVC